MSRAKRQSIDWLTLSIYFAMVGIGWAMIYASGYDVAAPRGIFDFSTEAGKQGIWIALSLVLGVFVFVMDIQFFKALAAPIYIGSILLLLVVLFLGATTNGATSWIEIPGVGFKIQPSEPAKFATCLALAAYLSYKQVDFSNIQFFLVSVGIFLLPMVLVLAQGDAGSALVFASFSLVLYRAGMSSVIFIIAFTFIGLFVFTFLFKIEYIAMSSLVLGALVLAWSKPKLRYFYTGLVLLGVLGVVIWHQVYFWEIGAYLLGLFILLLLRGFWANERQLSVLVLGVLIVGGGFVQSVDYLFSKLEPHQQNRVLVWLQPDKFQPLEPAMYNLTMSKTAIGSGGVTGKGFLNGTMTKGNYVPEQSTDFIFSIVGEEQGFLGSFFVIVLFTVLLVRITMIAERQRSQFTKYYGYGVAGILAFHLLINVGMTLGIMPVIGIPLPMISYGGSSLLAFTLLLMVLLKMDSQRLLVFR